MKQVVIDKSERTTKVIDVPEPTLREGGVIVQTLFSGISFGTENAILKSSKKSLIAKAVENPELVKSVLSRVKQKGLSQTIDQVKGILDSYLPLGYSSVGKIIKVANDVTEFKVGDRVACAGAEYAWHAEKVFVPKNLIVKVPNKVKSKDAAFTTIASIALNGLRCTVPEIGQTVVVIGLGLLGALTCQIAKSAGLRVIGIDLDQRKVNLAKKFGADLALERNEENYFTIMEFTGGVGADSVIITASTDSNDPVDFAGQIARDHGKISIIGSVGLDIPRENYYKKELSVVIPRSYGPGRYDRNYEELGIDYPIGYARWTIARNMNTVLNLMSENKLVLSEIITDTVPIDSAPKAYSDFESSENLIMGLLIEYETNLPENPSDRVITREGTKKEGIIKCGIVGAGNYATSTFLPVVSKIEDISLNGLVTASGITGNSIAKKYSIPKQYSDYNDLLRDDSLDLIFVMTRNSLHAPIVLSSIQNNLNVFVEKPLAITIDELNKIEKAWHDSTKTIMVGFNRRYSDFTKEILNFFKKRSSPMISFYRVNSDPIPSDHWVHDKKEGGGMIISEACHFIDYLCYVTQSNPVKIFTNTIVSEKNYDVLDNFTIQISFEDGSIGNILYTTHGSSNMGKEYVEIFADNKSAVLDNFQALKSINNKKITTLKNKSSQDKGHRNEVLLLLKNLKNGKRMEDEFISSLNSSRATLAAYKSIISGVPEKL